MESLDQATLEGPPVSAADTGRPSTLAGFAAFINEHLVAEFVEVQLEGAQHIELPMLKHVLQMPAEAVKQASIDGARELLVALATGRIDEYITTSLARWRRDELGIVGKLQVVAADITGVNLLRKNAFLALLPRYTGSLSEALHIIGEIDAFIHRQATASFVELTRMHEEAAASRQQFIERVSAAVPGTLYVLNTQTMAVEYINDHLPHLMGYTAEEFKALGSEVFARVVHADDTPEAASYYAAIGSLADGEVRSHKYRAVRKDGSVVWVRSYDTPFRRSASGSLTHIVGFSFDITTEKEAAEALREREAQLLEAQEIGQIGSYVLDIRTNTSRGTPKLHALLELDDVSDWERYEAHVHPDDLPMVRARLEEAYTKTGVYQCTYRYRTSSGERYLACNGKVEYDDKGTPLTMRGTVQDVTETEKLLRRLRRSEKRYRMGESVARLGVFVWDIGSEKARWSAELFRLYGLDGEEDGLIDRTVMRQYVIDEDKDKFDAEIARAMAERRPFELPYGIVTPNGTRKQLYSRAEFVPDENTGKLQLVGTVQDVTPLHDAEELLKGKNEQLRQSNASLQEFAYIASHDLQEPLRKISTFGTMLQSHAESQLDERAGLYLQKIIDSASRLQSMISDLLDFSRISSEKGFERVPLGPLLAEAAAALEHRIEASSARVEASGLPEAVVVPSQIKQLFQNLLANSLKFAKPGVPPVIRVTHHMLSAEEAAAKCGLTGKPQYIELDFEDNGIGFDNQYAGKIFTIFQRLHGRAEYEGSGIGLSICKKIVEHAGGCINASGEEGVGATFTVVLPA